MPRAVVTGGAGFLGSHLCDRLLAEGWEVVCVDSLLTGETGNLSQALAHPRFEFRRADVSLGLEVEGPVQAVLHFASPASPVDYQRHPIRTLRAGAFGTHHALELARRAGAVFLLASTSEVYGDPRVHPQPETYWGNVNPVGPRSIYDEAKRYAEAVAMAYHRAFGLPVRVARIFNTYGPRMRRDDGRAVPTFVAQALAGAPLTVHGEGTQTRSLCYVDDMVEALWRLLRSDHIGPMNLGNPEEVTVRELAEQVRDLARSRSPLTFVERPQDDPEVRRPDISLARRTLGWEPTISLREGLRRTIAWAREAWEAGQATAGRTGWPA
jgi:dTDP-glucose 4,6-dehydratase